MSDTERGHKNHRSDDRESRRREDKERRRYHDRSRSRSRDRRDRDRDERSHRHRDDDGKERRHRRRNETEEERRERKRARRDKERGGRGEREGRAGVVDDDDDGGMWVEKSIDAADAASYIPTADSLALRSNVSEPRAPLPPTLSTASKTNEREAWMTEPVDPPVGGSATHVPAPEPSAPASASFGPGDDFFSTLGTEHKRKDPNALKPDVVQNLLVNNRELNTQFKEGKAIDEYKEEGEKKTEPGGPGYQWRMMKLRRLYEQAEEQARPVEDVALERYGSLAEFTEAVEERRIIDEREARKRQRRAGGAGTDAGYSSSSGMRTPDAHTRVVFSDSASRPGSRAGFRRPGEEPAQATPVAKAPPARAAAPQVSTPVPSVFTPQALTRAGSSYPFTTAESTSRPPLSVEQLNRLQAGVIRAKLADDPNAAVLEKEYEAERLRFVPGSGDQGGEGMWEHAPGLLGRDEDGDAVEYQVLPTLDGQGRLYDVGQGKEDDPALRPGNRRKKEPKFETRDKDGNLLRYNADDDDMSLGDMVREAKFGGGAADQKNLDAEMAAQISRDARFDDNLDYMDENAERLARKRMKTDAMKRQFAINDFARTKKALDTCPFCYQDDRPPLAAIVALGRRTYLCCTQTEELVPGHCLIVPQQHYLSSLQMDDDDWDEVRNFMKCLMRMFHAQGQGVLFYETILSFRQQRHTFIECVPVPHGLFEDMPAYFKEAILASETEWSQHKKLIDFSARPGGFRRALVPNLPYFMVHWDYKGEKGYGHVIEGVDKGGSGKGNEDELGMPIEEGDRGGGDFPPYFAGEIIGSQLDLEPRRWRNPRKIDFARNTERARALGTQFQPYNWTLQL
ncbi:Pre-mRNA-splicing factor cwf19 [Cryptotrichosporon argae]